MDLSFMERFLPMYVTAAQLTLNIALIGIAISVVIGIAASLALYYRIPGLRQLVAVYVELSRNTPLLVQLFFLYFGLPKIGIRLSPEICGIIGLSFLGGAYMTETFRAGLETVERIQSESALSLGMSQAATMRYVILPQAIKNILPALGNEFITIIKDSSLLSAIGVMELWNGATTVSTTTYLPLTPLLFAAFYYLIMTSILTLALKAFENRMGQGDKK